MMKYRICTASLQQETNSFSPAHSVAEDFEQAWGEAALGRLSVEPLTEAADVTVIPGYFAHAVPSGRLSRAVFFILLNRLLETLPTDADGVFLYLHGALDIETAPGSAQPGESGDAAIVRAVREKVGDGARIAVAMDFHANVSPALLRDADVVCAYRTAPHMDMEDTQRRACALLLHCLRQQLRPGACMVRIPMLFTGDCVITENPPAKALMERMEELESAPGMLSMTFCFGQAWVDTPWVGPCVLAYAETTAQARKAAQTLALDWWNARREFRFLTRTCLPEEAYAICREFPGETVFFSDSGDNTTAGAAGDRAGMLSLAVKCGGKQVLIAGITDAPAVAACEQAGEGAELTLTIGGTLDGSHTDRFTGVFRVERLCRILGWYGDDAGSAAVVTVKSGPTVILTRNRCAVTSPEIIRSVGLEPFDYRAVVVKLGYLYPALAAAAKHAVFVMTEGASTARIETIPFTAAPRNIFPIVDIPVFDPEPLTFDR